VTSALLRRQSIGAAPQAAELRPRITALAHRMRQDDAAAQFARFVFVGGVSSLLYALLFVALDGFGDQASNIAGALASSALANEMHRRLTFHAGERVSWITAQWEGGGMALLGMVATSLALGWWDATVDAGGDASSMLVVAVVTGAIGLIRFVALRWAFGARSADRA
jgi:putative flippase GtrA